MDRFEEQLMMNNGFLAKESEFWNNEFKEKITYPDFKEASLKGKRFEAKQSTYIPFDFKFNDILSKKIRNVTKENTKGIYMLILSGLFYTISRFISSQDMVIGTCFLNAAHNMDDYINFILPIRIKIKDGLSFKEFLQEVKNKYILAERNINYPYSRMCEYAGTGKNELFEVFLTGGLDREPDLNCRLKMHVQVKKEIEIRITYQEEFFSQDYLQKFFEAFTNFYHEVLINPDISLKDINLIHKDDMKLIFEDFNNTDVTYKNMESIYHTIKLQAERSKDKVVINCGGRNYTYGDLFSRVKVFIPIIHSKITGPGAKIVILNKKSFDSTAIMLAAIYNRAVCVPIDRTYPFERINFIIEETNADLVFYEDEEFKENFGLKGVYCKNIEENTEKEELITETAYEDPLFMIYTSGSTGKPKGVILNNRGILNHIYTKIKELDLEEKDVFCFNLNSAFVASIWQILTPLILGAKIYIYEDEVNKDIYELLKKAAKDKVSLLEIVPSMLGVYVQQIEDGVERIPFDSLKKLVLTGEVLKSSLLNRLYPMFSEKVEFINAYGQSEASDDTLHYHIKRDRKYGVNVPIGYPSNNTKVFILDRNQKLQPIGAIGQICITGTGIVEGYYKREELTNEKFVENPYMPGREMFLTGDMACWNNDGTIYYIGRTDHQLKIRGNRVELDEIENVLADTGYIKESVLTVKCTEEANELYAYVVLKDGYTVEAVREEIKQYLPAYMVPCKIVKIPKIPLLPNGKTDRRALLEINAEEDSINYEEASTMLQKKLELIWKKVLGISKVNINQDFFNSGGDSLKAVTIVTSLNKEGYNIRYNTLIKYPTIKMLEKHLITLESEDKSIEQLKNEILQRYGNNLDIVNNGKDKIIYYVEDTKWFWENIKELRNIIPRKLYPDQVIVRTEKPEDFFNGENEVQEEVIRKIVSELEAKGGNFEQIMMSNKVKHEFLASPVQELTADLSGHMTGIILPIRELVTYDEVNAALQKLIRENQLLHAVIKNRSDSITWRELECEKVGDVPYLDLSLFHKTDQTKFLKVITKECYYKVYFAEEKLLYRFFIIRLQANLLLLIAPIDHILFDGMSSEVIIQSLNENLFENSTEQKNLKNDYEDYVLQIREGIKNVTIKELDKIFRLSEFYNNNVIIANRLIEGQSREFFELKVKAAINMNSNGDKLLELSLTIAYIICRETFGITDIPIKMFSYGREYEEKNFYNVIGYFTDFIPVLLSSEDGSQEFIHIKYLLDYIKKHNINFTALGISEAGAEITEKLSMNKSKFSENLIFYNFQGKREGYDEVKMYYSLGTEEFNSFRLESSGFSIISYYTQGHLYVDVLSKIFLDEKKIKASLFSKTQNYFQNTEQDIVIKCKIGQ